MLEAAVIFAGIAAVVKRVVFNRYPFLGYRNLCKLGFNPKVWAIFGLSNAVTRF
ncbi:hypothetical protein GGTG_04764 [Gaeumannomyces tritici R3-111a-1]|uniref:Uncharacterized protein n=1 Tax=Gaeumannomyces tritici (strain R3-111a-1) TaxID=644352 RepID=J3NU15_GAET3|nr:hypothetical protein GGTG_04764 [Gaeumannomyces tritici R3-111a-1]EJT79680.1 hypothetical protein GGTG_04764 [Gaeumannomyces tritici R3-111a-1]